MCVTQSHSITLDAGHDVLLKGTLAVQTWQIVFLLCGYSFSALMKNGWNESEKNTQQTIALLLLPGLFRWWMLESVCVWERERRSERILSAVTWAWLDTLTLGRPQRLLCMNCGECGSLCVCMCVYVSIDCRDAPIWPLLSQYQFWCLNSG